MIDVDNLLFMLLEITIRLKIIENRRDEEPLVDLFTLTTVGCQIIQTALSIADHEHAKHLALHIRAQRHRKIVLQLGCSETAKPAGLIIEGIIEPCGQFSIGRQRMKHRRGAEVKTLLQRQSLRIQMLR